MSPRLRVVLVDDHRLFRAGVRSELNDDTIDLSHSISASALA